MDFCKGRLTEHVHFQHQIFLYLRPEREIEINFFNMQILRKTLFAVCISMLSAGLFAQSVDDVGAKFNEGLEAMKAKQYATAVTAFEAAIKLANTVGAGASDLKDNSMKQLVDAYYRNGVTMYKSKKYDGAVAEFDKGIKMAKQTGDSEMEEKLVVVSAKVLSSKGLSLIKDNDLDGAWVLFGRSEAIIIR
jgi:tetratricopeptide (TPR) repeat protein